MSRNRNPEKILLAAGIAGLAVCALALLQNPQRFWTAYLVALLYWLGVSLGALFFGLIHPLTGGGWGNALRSELISAARNAALLAALFFPVLFGARQLYLWARPEAVEANAHLAHKAVYLNLPFFALRAAIYFAAWILISRYLNRKASDPRGRALRGFSGPALVAWGLTVTFAAFDWGMSLDPLWASTAYGVLFIAGNGLSALAVLLTLKLGLSELRGERELETNDQHDLGNLLMAFTLLWAYVNFSQYLIIWSGNLPEEIGWVLARTRGGWQWLPLALAVFHLAVPLALLLSRTVKRSRMLLYVAGLISAFRLVDLWWFVLPTVSPGRLSLHWADVLAPAAVGALWLSFFLRTWRANRALPDLVSE